MATSGSSIQETECGLSIQSGRLSQVGRRPGRSVNVDVDTSRYVQSGVTRATALGFADEEASPSTRTMVEWEGEMKHRVLWLSLLHRSDPIDWSMFEARPRTPSWCRRAEAAWRARNKVNSMLRQKQGKGEAGCTGLQGMQLVCATQFAAAGCALFCGAHCHRLSLL